MELNLIRKVAWSFVKTTGLEFDELFSEASLAYVQAEAKYNPDKSQFSTFIYQSMKNHLCSYCKKEYQENHAEMPEEYEPVSHYASTENTVFFKESISNLSEEGRIICNMIFESPEEYLSLNKPKIAKGYLKNKLREIGWTWEKIWNGFSEVKKVLRVMEEV
ncbi:MAG TPA: sigma factor [Bacteroidales bacterium]|nr:sigma factor [Bacteroidales bacterium]